MAIRQYDGIADASDDARMAVIGEDGLSAFAIDKLYPDTLTGSSPVDLIVHFADVVYANFDGCSADVREIAAGCALVAERYGFHQFNVDSRGSRIAAILDGQDIPNTPEPNPSFVEPAPVEQPAEQP
jgi:hypothetical protein